jgi:hypothetical protein
MVRKLWKNQKRTKVKQKSSQMEIGTAQNRAECISGHQVQSMVFELEINCLAGGLAVVRTFISVTQ